MSRGKDDLMWFPHTFDPVRKYLTFDYVNHRDRRHHYVVDPEAIALGSYDASGIHQGPPNELVLHAMTITRDGDPRLDMGSRRRTFLINKMTNIDVQEAS